MFVDDLIRRPGLWANAGPDAGIVISGRLRLARNLTGFAFPGWARDEDRPRLAETAIAALQTLSELEPLTLLAMDAVSSVDRDVLKERHLISHELACMGSGSYLAVGGDERVAIMVNEEDHLRLQAISPGMSLFDLWTRLDAIDSALESRLPYAFSQRLGYLTACPSNVGTGLRASVMLHLSGLRLLNEIEPVIKGLERIGLAVRGQFGEGSDAQGNVFQISNQTTLGEPERDIVERLVQVAGELVRHESNARARLMEDQATFVRDHVGRALGILLHASLLNSREVLDLLMALCLGVDLGLVEGLQAADIHELMLLTQPGHLQKIYRRDIGPDERDAIRAHFVKQKVSDVLLVE